jgi:formylglycine-generating enzyme required for sulfatase activity
MVLIPAGSYKPLYRTAAQAGSVPMAAFYLDVRPVTNGEFLAFVRANPAWRRSRASPVFAEAGYLRAWAGDLELGPRAPAGSPVVDVSWFAARAFAQWEGKRLPTMAEWERVAAAGYEGPDGASEAAYRRAVLEWFARPSPPVPAPSGSGRRNVYGVRDMVDLVWEWVDDFDAIVPSNAQGGPGRSLFCGAASVGARDFANYPAFMRAAFRSSLQASYALPCLGFRCAKTPGP